MQIDKYWEEIMRAITMIPSERFRKLIIKTSDLCQYHLEYLIHALKLVKQKISVEIRCKSIDLQLESSESD
jgi:hypothetical protein